MKRGLIARLLGGMAVVVAVTPGWAYLANSRPDVTNTKDTSAPSDGGAVGMADRDWAGPAHSMIGPPGGGESDPPPHETGPVYPLLPRPAVPPPGVILDHGPWVRGIYESIQVNVDENGQNIPGDAANEPSIAIDPTDPNKIVIGWRQFDSVESDFRQAGWAYSHDGGQTWTFPGVLEPGVFRSDPVLDSGPDGTFYYYSLNEGLRCALFRSHDGGVSWLDPVSAYGGDKPWMTVDRTDGIGRGHIYAMYRGIFTRSVDGGESFERPVGGPGAMWGTLAVGPDGEVYGTGKRDHTPIVVNKSTSARDANTPVGIDLADEVKLGGHLSKWTVNGDGLDGQAWVAVDHSDGPTRSNVYLLASVEPDGMDPLDVMFARSTNGGGSWSEPIRINDDLPAHFAWQWFGTMAVAPDGRIDVIWNNTSSKSFPYTGLYYAYSLDAGLTWSKHIPVSPPFNPGLGMPKRQSKLGDYYDMISDEFGANVSYAATFNEEQDVYFLRIPAYDCNGNGIDDREEIRRGLLEDCTGNGLPDICERDCNENHSADSCDIALGKSKDCNTNGIPDECDIEFEQSEDCTDNGIPDECEPDCNRNRVADSCDIFEGVSEDLNVNGIPDECEPDCSANPSKCKTWFVDDDAPPGGDGKSWQTAFNRLQDALAVEGKGHQIWVAQGVYKPAGPSGDRNATFQLKNGLAVYGGFNGSETQRGQRNPDFYETIISGDLNGDDGAGFKNNDENSYHVVTAVSVGPSAILDGLTVVGGNATGESTVGGGMYIKEASPRLRQVTFRVNLAERRAGAIYIREGSARLENCVFSRNRSGGCCGGAISSDAGDIALVGCVFRENSTEGSGGGIHHGSGGHISALSLRDCTFIENTAAEEGGAVYVDGTDGIGDTMINCKFFGNWALKGGGAVSCSYRSRSSLTVTQCVFSGNRTGGLGGGLSGRSVLVSNSTFSRNVSARGAGGISIRGEFGLGSTVASCIVWGNRGVGRRSGRAQIDGDRDCPRVSYSCVQQLNRRHLNGSGNIGDDPLFVDRKGPDRIAGTEDDNLRLLPGSPCIDAGSNDSVLPDIFDLDGDGNMEEPTPYDLDGQPRQYDDPNTPDTGWGTPPIVDIGAYEFSRLCQSIRRMRVRCNEAGTLTARFKTKLEQGRWLTASLMEGASKRVVIGPCGKGKARWRNLASGTYKVCVVECPGMCDAAECH